MYMIGDSIPSDTEPADSPMTMKDPVVPMVTDSLARAMFWPVNSTVPAVNVLLPLIVWVPVVVTKADACWPSRVSASLALIWLIALAALL